VSNQSPDLAVRLRPAFDGGKEIEQRLRLRRAAIQAQLAENHSARILLRALSAPEYPKESAVEARG
jgi:hypothetical protein